MQPAFVKQTDQPLFPEIFWNRPTIKSRGGRLLIIGGQPQQFSLVQAIYQLAEAAGIGECQAIIPDSLRRTVGETGFARFAPASTSGSLGKAALGEILSAASDMDGIVIGANLSNNAETAVLIEALLSELEKPVIITEEAINVLKFHPALISGNPKALVVTSMNGLFGLANYHHMPIAIKPNSGVIGKIEILQQLSAISRCQYMVFDHEILVAAEGEISLTGLNQSLSNMPGAALGVASTFWLQHPGKAFTALTTAAFVLAQSLSKEATPSYTSIATPIAANLKKYEQ